MKVDKRLELSIGMDNFEYHNLMLFINWAINRAHEAEKFDDLQIRIAKDFLLRCKIDYN